MNRFHLLTTLLLACAFAFSSCSKDDGTPEDGNDNQDSSETIELNIDIDNENISATSPVDGSDYYWMFDDGKSAFEKEISHKYAEPGTYNVQLEVQMTDSTFKIEREIAIDFTKERTIAREWLCVAASKEGVSWPEATGGRRSFNENGTFQYGDYNYNWTFNEDKTQLIYYPNEPSEFFWNLEELTTYKMKLTRQSEENGYLRFVYEAVD